MYVYTQAMGRGACGLLRHGFTGTAVHIDWNIYILFADCCTHNVNDYYIIHALRLTVRWRRVNCAKPVESPPPGPDEILRNLFHALCARRLWNNNCTLNVNLHIFDKKSKLNLETKLLIVKILLTYTWCPILLGRRTHF